MNRTTLAAPLVLALTATASIASLHVARAQAPGRPSAAPYAAQASASASADLTPPPVTSGPRRWVPAVDVTPPPEQPTPAPTRDEWQGAPVAREARVTEPHCDVYRLREWYRIACRHVAIQLVAGNRADVTFASRFASKGDERPEEVSVVFPARRGDRRFFQVYTTSKWASATPDAQASEQWLDGDPLPLITVQGLRWGI